MNLLEDTKAGVLVRKKRAKKWTVNYLKGKDREEDLHPHPANPGK